MVRLEDRILIRAPLARCFHLARSVEVHLAGNIHFGEQALATGGVTTGLIGPGQRVTWRARHFGIRFYLTSEITAYESPTYFRDQMVRGPFRLMCHDHWFRSLPSGATEMRDQFVFAGPIPVLGRVAESLFLRAHMQKLLQERNRVIQQIAESSEWRRYLPEELGCES